MSFWVLFCPHSGSFSCFYCWLWVGKCLLSLFLTLQLVFFLCFLNLLNAGVALIYKPVNWFAQQINWLVSIWGLHQHLMGSSGKLWACQYQPVCLLIYWFIKMIRVGFFKNCERNNLSFLTFLISAVSLVRMRSIESNAISYEISDLPNRKISTMKVHLQVSLIERR